MLLAHAARVVLVLWVTFNSSSGALAFDWNSVGASSPNGGVSQESVPQENRDQSPNVTFEESADKKPENPIQETTSPPELSKEVAAEKTVSANEGKSPETAAEDKKVMQEFFASEREVFAYYAVVALLLFLNFCFYLKFEKLRPFLLAIPFFTDKTSRLPESAESSKRILESLLLGVSVVCFYFFGLSIGDDKDLMGALIDGLLHYFITHLLYLIAKYAVAVQSTCPKCKTPYSISEGESWREPASTFQAGNIKNSAGRIVPKIMEVGVEYTNKNCDTCSYSWTIRKRYKKQVLTLDRFL